MSKFRPTPSQSAAINARGSAVLVSAGAGSGKTKVLTERLMSRITDPNDFAELDSFLVITFTRAAAGELRGRIMDALAEALAGDPGNKRLRRQSALCQRAQIETIHGFCAAVLRENSHLIGLSPDYKIADDDRAQAMKLSALERVMDSHYEKADAYEGFSYLVDTVGVGRDDRRLAELVLKLHGKMQCHARPELWAKRQVALLAAPVSDLSQTPWGKEVLDWAKETAEYWSGQLDMLIEAMQPYEKISAAYLPSISDGAEAVRRLSRALDKGWDEARKCLPFSFSALGRLTNSPEPQLSDYIKAQKDACKKAMDGIQNALASDSAKLMEEMALTAPAMSALLELTLSFDDEFSRAKRRAGLVDYSDLEHLTAKLLTEEDGLPTALAGQIASRYTEIMVDEYQDVSLVQDAIFRAVSKDGRNLFMVGDVKQAIYRFRLADPKIFTEKYLSYKDADCASAGEPRRIILQENFRSRREIIDCANSVFSVCMSRSLGDIDYDGDAALKYGASYEGSVPVPELLILDIQKPEQDEESPEKTASEAEMVADKIIELMDSGVTVTDGGSQRPLRYGDIAILLRSANTVGGTYRSVLARQGIPVSMGQGSDFFRSIEISALMSLLAIIDNPHQDIPLIAVLRSPFVGLSPDDLSKIRESDRAGDFYTALITMSQNDKKRQTFIAILSALRRSAPDLSAAELLWKIYSDLDMLAICSAMPDGEQRRANLMEMISLSERFESSGYKGLHRFVLWLRRLCEKNQDIAPAGDSASSVQILSVHKSKGLEFPIVFLSDTARLFNKKDSRDTVLVHPELGLGPKLTDTARRLEYPTLARNAIKLRSERELLSEEIRLLYVALTRARERLFITAAMKGAQRIIEKAAAAVTLPMAPQVLKQATSPISWLIYAGLAKNEKHLKISLQSKDKEIQKKDPEKNSTFIEEYTDSKIEQKLCFSYPFQEAALLPSKITATELKNRTEEDREAKSIISSQNVKYIMPDFGKPGEKAKGTEKGIATHLVLQNINFSKCGDLENICKEIERLRDNDFISQRDAEAVDAQAILKLFSSDLGKRMLNADIIKRELKFSILCDAEELFGKAHGEKLLMQGVVDCCIEENEQLIIIDYKTDTAKTLSDIDRLAAQYTGQLRAYTTALQRIYKKTVKECDLYFLAAGETIKIPEKDLH